MDCVICKKDLGFRPSNILLQHKAEGIHVHAICNAYECWCALGELMVQGKR